MSATYWCLYCDFKESTFGEAVRHLINSHSTEELKIRKLEKNILKTINFKVVPEIAREQGRVLTVNEQKESIHLSKPNLVPKKQPP